MAVTQKELIQEWLENDEPAKVILTTSADVDIGAVDVASIAAGTNNIGDVDIATITAGETHIGEVSCNSIAIATTPVINTVAYTAADVVGAIQTLTAASRVSGAETILQSIVITDLAMQSAAFSIFFFNASPAAGTYTNNAELDIHDTDMAKCVGAVTVAASDWINAKDNGVAVVKNIGLGMTPNGSANLFYVMKTTTTPTYAVGDLVLTFFFLRD